jgi:hypothetical protein
MKVAHPPLAFKEQQKKKSIKRLSGLLDFRTVKDAKEK